MWHRVIRDEQVKDPTQPGGRRRATTEPDGLARKMGRTTEGSADLLAVPLISGVPAGARSIAMLGTSRLNVVLQVAGCSIVHEAYVHPSYGAG